MLLKSTRNSLKNEPYIFRFSIKFLRFYMIKKKSGDVTVQLLNGNFNTVSLLHLVSIIEMSWKLH
jgi:hypothetical protein